MDEQEKGKERDGKRTPREPVVDDAVLQREQVPAYWDEGNGKQPGVAPKPGGATGPTPTAYPDKDEKEQQGEKRRSEKQGTVGAQQFGNRANQVARAGERADANGTKETAEDVVVGEHLGKQALGYPQRHIAGEPASTKLHNATNRLPRGMGKQADEQRKSQRKDGRRQQVEERRDATDGKERA